MIRKAMEITTNTIQSAFSQPLLAPSKENTLKPIHPNKVCGTSDQPPTIRPYPITPKGLAHPINSSIALHCSSSQITNGTSNEKREDYQSNGSSDEKVSFPEFSENRESQSETASKSLSDEYDSDTQTDRGRISRDENESSQSVRDWNVYNEFMTKAPQLKNLHSDSISCLDVVYLWEYGTDEMLPIRLWNEAELESGGDVIRRWQQIMNIFKEDCRCSLRTFVNKFTTADGKLMSVKDVLSIRRQDTVNSNCTEGTENKISDSCSAVSGSQSEIDSKVTTFRTGSMTSNGSQTSLQCGVQTEPCFVLPRKINGQKVSAKDVIRLWEDGFCNIPPIKTWTPSQKLKQQSKISRWKKIVDIFKTECNGEMKLFEMVYKNDSGSLLPIAAIITKHEQNHNSVDMIGHPTMSTISTSTIDVKVDKYNVSFSHGSDRRHRHNDFRSPYNTLHELAREWDFIEAQSCKERRAFAIRQVENWQRNIIQPQGNGTGAEHLGSNTNNMPKAFEDKGDNFENRTASHLNHKNMTDSYSRNLQKNSKTREEAVNADFRNGFDEIVTKNPDQRFQSNDECKIKPTICVTACAEERKEPDESSFSDSSDTSSCKDIDVTGSITSESSAPSKSYSPVPSKLGKSLKTIKLVNTEKGTMSSTREQNEVKEPAADSSHVSDTESSTQVVYHNLTSLSPDVHNALPECDDPLEIVNLWEHGTEQCPPLRFLATKPELIRDPRLAAWRKFIGIFHYFCNGDKQILLQKYTDEHGKLLRVSEILQGFDSGISLQQYKSMSVANAAVQNSQPCTNSLNFTQAHEQLDTKTQRNDINIYTLPRKINGHKVSAKDVIHIWNHGLKNIPAVKSWLPNQKVRQQSKISRWKKIVEIFEVDCGCNMQSFEQKYSNKSGDLLPIAAIIAKYEAEKTAIDGDSGLNIKVDTMT